MIFFYTLTKKLKEQYILHPYLIIIYFLLHHYISFNEAHRWYEPIVAIIVILAFGFLLKFVVQKFIFDKFNASYIISFITICFLFYSDIHQTAYSIFPFYIRHRYFLLFVLFFALLFFTYLKYSKRSYQLNLFLNTILIVYLLIDFSSLLLYKFKVTSNLQIATNKDKIKTDNLPDIYLLLMDGYASNQNLRKYYHFNNNILIDFLKKRNFKIIENSKSNYFYTMLTMSSALNMRYHTKEQRNIQLEMMELIENNIFSLLLEKHRYQIKNLSIFHFKDSDTKYGLTIWMNRSSLFFYFFSKTPLFIFYAKIEKGEGFSRELGVFHTLDSLTKIKNETPKFVYAHILFPHPPFYLNELGKYDKKVEDRSVSLSGKTELVDDDPNNNTMGSSEADSLLKIDYINHIKYTNKKCIEAISTILKYNKRPPIIILMSDHGSRMLTNPASNAEAVKERYENMCAIYYPDKDYSKLYDSITPINVMRQVLNKSIGTKYSNLKDISGLVIE